MKYEAKQIPEGINTTQEHPLKELFILLAGVGGLLLGSIAVLMLASDYLVQFIPIETEQRWFDSKKFEFIESDQLSTNEQDVEQYLVSLIDRLNQNNPAKATFSIRLIDDEMPNAFITPGAHIFVTTELFRYVKSENGLAMILAHEMAHQVHRHPIRSMGRGLVIAIALMTITGFDGGDWVADMISSSINLGLLAYSREQEREADKTGVKLLMDVYGHAGGSTEFFDELAKHDEFKQTGFTEYLSTHPNTEARIKFLQTFSRVEESELVPLPGAINQLLQNKAKSPNKS